MKIIALIVTAITLSGCSGGIGPWSIVRVMEPNVAPIDVAELAANLKPNQGAVFSYRYDSAMPDETSSYGGRVEMNADTLMRAVAAGANIASSGQGYEKAISDIAIKGRTLDVFLAIMQSEDMAEALNGRPSREQGRLIRDRWLDITERDGVVVGTLSPEIEGSPSDPAVEREWNSQTQVSVISDSDAYMVMLPTSREWTKYRVREKTGRIKDNLFADATGQQWITLPKSLTGDRFILDIYVNEGDEDFTVFDINEGDGVYDYNAGSPVRL